MGPGENFMLVSKYFRLPLFANFFGFELSDSFTLYSELPGRVYRLVSAAIDSSDHLLYTSEFYVFSHNPQYKCIVESAINVQNSNSY